MKVNEAVTILKQFQKWRRGADIPMQDPKLIGGAIDVAIRVLNKQLIKLK